MKHRTLYLLVPLMGIILVGCGTAAPAGKTLSQPTIGGTQMPDSSRAHSSEDLTRTDTQGMVSVDINPINLEKPDKTLDFDVSLNTHSVALDMNLVELATLSTDTGLTVKATKWDAPSGGHHVSGKLSFPTTVDGKALLSKVSKLTLTLHDVDAPERTFQWEISQ